MLDKVLKILLGMSMGMCFVCLVCIAAIKCTELDIKQLEKETAFFNKQTAELSAEAEEKKVQYFETLSKVYTAERVKKEMDKNNKAKGWY